MNNPSQPPREENDRLTAGDLAVVTTGSFAGQRATVAEIVGDSAEVEMSISGKTIAVRLPLKWLEWADGERPFP